VSIIGLTRCYRGNTHDTISNVYFYSMYVVCTPNPYSVRYQLTQSDIRSDDIRPRESEKIRNTVTNKYNK